MKFRNLFKGLPRKMSGELFSIMAKAERIEIERIVSRGHCSPPGFWYDQDFDEWVLLLRGAAVLRISGNKQKVRLKEGDYLLIPAHRRHRVEWTHPAKQTVWLAIKGRRIVACKKKPASHRNRFCKVESI